jgi:hypothetical protein
VGIVDFGCDVVGVQSFEGCSVGLEVGDGFDQSGFVLSERLGGLVQLRLSVGQISGVSSDIVSKERLGLRALLSVFCVLGVISSLCVFQLTLDFVHEAGDLAQ